MEVSTKIIIVLVFCVGTFLIAMATAGIMCATTQKARKLKKVKGLPPTCFGKYKHPKWYLTFSCDECSHRVECCSETHLKPEEKVCADCFGKYSSCLISELCKEKINCELKENEWYSQHCHGILKRARDTYGYKNQILVSMEELNELACVLAKYGRYEKHEVAIEKLKSKVLDELADVCIIANHVQSIFEISEKELEIQALNKLKRLERWMDKSGSLEQTTIDRELGTKK